jgi:glucose/arabinose dehydrogenase
MVVPRFFAARPTGAGVDPSPPNASGQVPAFPGQTRAPERKANVAFDVITVAQQFENPWGVAFLPGGRMLVTERPGRLRVVGADGRLSAAVAACRPSTRADKADSSTWRSIPALHRAG